MSQSEDDVSKKISTTENIDTDTDNSISLLSITDGENDRGIPNVKFIDDVDVFSNSFTPPASAELLIGAYSELHSKFKTFETSLTQKSTLSEKRKEKKNIPSHFELMHSTCH